VMHLNEVNDVETKDHYIFDATGNGGRWLRDVEDFAAGTDPVTTDSPMTWAVNSDGNIDVTVTSSGAVHEIALANMNDTHRPAFFVQIDGVLVGPGSEMFRTVPQSTLFAEVPSPVDLTSDADVVGDYQFEFDPFEQTHFNSDGSVEFFENDGSGVAVSDGTATWTLDATDDTFTVDEDGWLTTLVFESINPDSQDVDNDGDTSELVYVVAGWEPEDLVSGLGVFFIDKMLEIQVQP